MTDPSGAYQSSMHQVDVTITWRALSDGKVMRGGGFERTSREYDYEHEPGNKDCPYMECIHARNEAFDAAHGIGKAKSGE